MSRRFFITGTGTSVGKTVVTASLLLAFHRRGIHCLPVKPVQTGWNDGGDVDWCLSFLDRTPHKTETLDLTFKKYPLPASPHLAARQSGDRIDIEPILRWLDVLARQTEMLLIEGAGGLLVPLNEKETMLDLIRQSGAAPVLVTHSGLGTLNHTALSLRELSGASLPPAAVVISETEPAIDETARLIRDDNIRMVEHWAAPAPVVLYPFHDRWTTDRLAEMGKPLAGILEP